MYFRRNLKHWDFALLNLYVDEFKWTICILKIDISALPSVGLCMLSTNSE